MKVALSTIIIVLEPLISAVIPEFTVVFEAELFFALECVSAFLLFCVRFSLDKWLYDWFRKEFLQRNKLAAA